VAEMIEELEAVSRDSMLSDQRWEDMFWDSYKLAIVAEDPGLQAEIATVAFWKSPAAEALSIAASCSEIPPTLHSRQHPPSPSQAGS
jgi:hypothetical protein